MKREVFAALEQVVSPESPRANTSSLSVAAMGEGLAHPERVVGLHFFNPVAVLPLVEVVRTPSTDDSTLATAWDVTRKLGKRGVLVKDAPAFVVNRMLSRQSTVVMQAIERGSTFEETDEAALRLGIPCLRRRSSRWSGRRSRTTCSTRCTRPTRTVSALADAAEAGRRRAVALAASDDRPSVDEIHERILEALADEPRHILDEGVVAGAAEIDACLLLGAGYPFFRGGITKHLDQTGVSERVTGRPLGDA